MFIAEENNDNQAEGEFNNPFCTPVREVAESSSRNIASANKTTTAYMTEMYMFADSTEEVMLHNQTTGSLSRTSLKKFNTTKESSIWIETSSESLGDEILFMTIQIHHSSTEVSFKSANTLIEILKKHGKEKGKSMEHSTSRGIQFLGDKIVSWMLKKRDCTAMSSAEAENVALSASCA
ncbi:hypothetical protein Tco_0803057 [Tanacetum coccineum]|uniref:Uncharacterized protein n=1 Tax=Tanacetum coccineum TaxID=301880 RepID=A0ABQ5A0K8_9ASTR